LNCLKQPIIQKCETYIYPTNLVNLAQAKELSLRQEGSLAQVTSSRLGETTYKRHIEVSLKLAHLAQASGLRLGEPSNQREGWVVVFSFRRELLT